MEIRIMKMGRFSLFLFMVLFGTQYVTSQKTMPDCPSEEDAMDHDLQIQATASMNIRLRYTAALSALEGNLSRDILAELTSDSIEAKAEELVSRDILEADLGPVGSAADLDIALPYYWRTCPYKWYVLWRYRWYWRYWSLQSDGTVILEYWWSPWWVWGTYCGASHCHWSYWPFTWVDSRYRCFPDYRLIRLPVYCYRIVFNTSNGIDSFGWLQTWRWRYVWVPRGCCCRKYWWFTISAAATCPAIPAVP
ncbi:uncharacterized protein LOC132758796 [Ruditapes philippinarum]|uniref:uncharacterized protein LOC132758796 n=1 Tax=Ruditapes philippinarum TaxID=129788 RepID=UPI00295BF343|nr:uncharacterized protein LOC132758796 [Ruditapes philippinarum]